MPLKRTPPSSSSTPRNTESLKAPTQKQTCLSDPNLGASCDENFQSPAFVTQRIKRRCDDEEIHIIEMLKELKAGQASFTSALKTVKEDLMAQNKKLQDSVEFLSAKYDDVLEQMKQTETDRLEDRKYIQQLEDKIDYLEKRSRYASVEIRNIPKQDKESKQDLLNIVREIGKSVNLHIQANDVKDTFRTNNKFGNKPVIVEFNSVILKESLIKSVISFNKNKSRDDKLNSAHLKIGGPKTPIYMSDNLCAKTRKLFAVTREFASANFFKYCWTSYGQIYLRKDDQSPRVRIDSERDLSTLKNKN